MGLAMMAAPPPSPSVLDLFCGVGGWSKSFAARGWNCVGVDIVDLGYPYRLEQRDVFTMPREWIDGFDCVVMSPPCEEFARAWLPWLRCDKSPAQGAIDLLQWSVDLCDRPGRIVECSKFAARHVPGAILCGSYALWGDVPLLLPHLPPTKSAKPGRRPELRAEIPAALAHTVERWFSRS